MSATALTVVSVGNAGTAKSKTDADTSNGNTFANNGRTYLLLSNTGTDSATVTIATGATVGGYAVDDRTVALAARSARNIEVTVALDTVLAGQTLTVNTVVFTAHADTTTAADREFAIDGDNTADAAALAGLINDATYGVPGVTAAADTGTITLTLDDWITGSITAVASDSTMTVTATETERSATEKIVGPFDPAIFNDANGLVTLSYTGDGAADVDVLAFN